jgi:predicted AlkP superfamily phosphohydrolase/phosphomutase
MKCRINSILAVSRWVWIVAVAVAAAGGCSGGEKQGTGGASAEKVSFGSFAEFMAETGADGSRAGGGHQVVFIGIDGATWRALDPLIEQGRLPNLERIKMEGCYGTLMSTPCYVSPPAWTSMLTGYAPEKTGVYTFGNFSWEEGKFSPLTAEDIEVPAVWDLASLAGQKVGVTNVPLTYPVRPVNGIMVSGLLTPVPLGNRLLLRPTQFTGDLRHTDVAPEVQSYSTPIKSEGSDSLNTFAWWRVDTTDNGVRDYDRLVLSVYPSLEGMPEGGHAQVHVFEIGEYSPWLQVRAVYEGEVRDAWCKFLLYPYEEGGYRARTSQALFGVRESGVQYTYPDELSVELKDRFVYYLPSKSLKPDVVPSVTLETVKYASFFYDYDDWDLFYYVFTQTDNIQHAQGFSPNAAKVYETIDRFLGELMRRLPEDCTLIVASDHGFKKFEWGVDINESLEQLGLVVRKGEENEIDFERTTAFHNMWHIYFNPMLMNADHLRALGVPIEDGERPRDALIDYLKEVMVLTDGEKNYPLTFTALSEDLPDDAPDLVVDGAYDNYMVEFWNIMRPRGTMMWELSKTEQYNHEREGVYFVWGNHVRSGIDTGVKQIEDIAPTMLYLLGLPVADDMDGTVMLDVFHESYIAQNPEFVIPDYNEIDLEYMAAKEDNESLYKKLKSLGYAQ